MLTSNTKNRILVALRKTLLEKPHSTSKAPWPELPEELNASGNPPRSFKGTKGFSHRSPRILVCFGVALQRADTFQGSKMEQLRTLKKAVTEFPEKSPECLKICNKGFTPGHGVQVNERPLQKKRVERNSLPTGASDGHKGVK